jgi:hypothetical protein
VEVYATFSSDKSLALFGRIRNPGTSSLSGYAVEFHAELGGVYVYRVTNNVYSSALGGPIAATFGRGARVGISIVGSTINVWLNTGAGWVKVGSRTDATYAAAGFIGAELYGGTNRSFDDFGGGTKQ